MIAVSIILATTLASAIACSIWLTYRLVRAVETDADARVAQVDVEHMLERSRFELEVTQQALAAANARAAALEEALSDEWSTPASDTDSDPGRAARRGLLRLAARWGSATAGGPLPAVAADDVRDAAAAESPGPAAVPGDGGV